MMNDESYSDEMLNAYVDGQLDGPERLRVLTAAQSDERLAERICELRQAKDLVRLAYADPPRPRGTRGAHRRASGWAGRTAAAVVLLAVGGIAGWMTHGQLQVPRVDAFELAADRREDAGRFILHVTSADPARLDAALSDTEDLVARFQANRRPVRVEVVANGEGLALLNADTSPYADRIRALVRSNGNVSFMACALALERMRLKGSEVRLLPEAQILKEGALDRIISRLQQGWAYIRV